MLGAIQSQPWRTEGSEGVTLETNREEQRIEDNSLPIGTSDLPRVSEVSCEWEGSIQEGKGITDEPWINGTMEMVGEKAILGIVNYYK